MDIQIPKSDADMDITEDDDIKGDKKTQRVVKDHFPGKLGYLQYWLKSKRNEILVGIIYVLTIFAIIVRIYQCGTAIFYLSDRYFKMNTLRIIFELVIPLFTWLMSTKYAFWNYRKQKIFGVYINIFNTLSYIFVFLLEVEMRFFLPFVFKIPVGQSVTEVMIITLGRVIITLFAGVITIIAARSIIHNLRNELTIKQIMYFKVNRNTDERAGVEKKFAYDMNIVRRMENGSMHTIREKDRSLHTMAIGTTGTGKTSTCLTNGINDDLDQKAYNEDWQKKRLYSLLKAGKIKMTTDFEDSNFSVSYFEASGKYKKQYDKIVKKAKIAGITAMAPNAAFADEIFNLAKIKGIKARRLDPELENGKHKEGFIGFNPLYVSPTYVGLERKIEIFSKSTIIADVLQAIFDLEGSSDPYFSSLNRNITTTLTSLLLLTYPSLNNGKQPTLAVLQSVINDFNKVKPYRDQLIKLYSKKYNMNGKDPVMEVGKTDVGEFQFIIDVIDNDLTGKGAEAMNNQARGLRIIINSIMVNPLIKDVLCADSTIDMDKMLSQGEVTVVNYALQLGSDGVAFGLFFMLSFIKAVMRRPGTENTRIPHFFYVDEFPTLLHPKEEACFTLFRQYRVSMFIALQTLDQMDKAKATAYLRGVLVGNCAHQIVFGRASTSEMEQYQKFAGKKKEFVEMNGVSETALSSDNPSYTMSSRETIQSVDVFETSDIRYRDFLEVTVFTVNKATPVPPFHGKVEFLSSYKRLKKKRRHYNWHKYYIPTEKESMQAEEKVTPIGSLSVQEAKTSVNEKKNQTEETKIEPILEASNIVLEEHNVAESNMEFDKKVSPGIKAEKKVADNGKENEDDILSFEIEEEEKYE